MSLLTRFDALVALDPREVPRDARFADLADAVARAELPELADLVAQVLRLARVSGQPWRPRTMHEWLT
jgi:hypothetical protein